ncbi:hypothetical protein J6590_035595 [Homalodisca vitripennis]|nr:hypothetical protein J6590_035595 [Homalodisca vitripennis]
MKPVSLTKRHSNMNLLSRLLSLSQRRLSCLMQHSDSSHHNQVTQNCLSEEQTTSGKQIYPVFYHQQSRQHRLWVC